MRSRCWEAVGGRTEAISQRCAATGASLELRRYKGSSGRLPRLNTNSGELTSRSITESESVWESSGSQGAAASEASDSAVHRSGS